MKRELKELAEEVRRLADQIEAEGIGPHDYDMDDENRPAERREHATYQRMDDLEAMTWDIFNACADQHQKATLRTLADTLFNGKDHWPGGGVMHPLPDEAKHLRELADRITPQPSGRRGGIKLHRTDEQARWLDISDVSVRLNTSKKTLYRWIKKGRFPRPNMEKPTWRWLRAAVEAWERQAQGEAVEATRDAASRVSRSGQGRSGTEDQETRQAASPGEKPDRDEGTKP